MALLDGRPLDPQATITAALPAAPRASTFGNGPLTFVEVRQRSYGLSLSWSPNHLVRAVRCSLVHVDSILTAHDGQERPDLDVVNPGSGHG
jgi:hypothetical protein